MEIRPKCERENCYNNEIHSHEGLNWLAGHVRYMPTPDPISPDKPKCDWITANSLTDHELVKCTTEATHKVNDADEPGITFLCLAHADLYRTITHQMPERINLDS